MVRVSNSLLVALSLTLLGPLSVSAQGIEARFSTEKTNYLVGEPLFVILTVSNKTSETTWFERGSAGKEQHSTTVGEPAVPFSGRRIFSSRADQHCRS